MNECRDDAVNEKAREKAMEILNVFEELLDKYEINIPNGDRENHPTEARIYGSNYYFLEDKITEIIEVEE